MPKQSGTPACKRGFILSVMALVILASVQKGTGQESLMVSFSRIELSGNSDAAKIELAWNVFKKTPGQDSFQDHTPLEPLTYQLIIEGVKDTITRDTRYVYSGPLKLNKKYDATIKIATESIDDNTDHVNQKEDKEFNRATFSLVKVRRASEFPVFSAVFLHFRNFLRHGSVLGIAPILTAVFALGILSGILYGIRFSLPRTWSKYIRREGFAFDRATDKKIKGPVANVIGIATRKLRQYDYRRMQQHAREQDSHIPYRIEKSIQDATENELNHLAGRSGNPIINFFFSIEHFWNLGVLAPFVGLLGTVTGISKAFGTVSFFSGLTTFAFKDIIDRLSSGINEALYTTIGGLVVGIILLGFYYFFVWRLDCVNKALDEVCDFVVKRV